LWRTLRRLRLLRTAGQGECGNHEESTGSNA
jgi:hypothetical protein